MATPIKPEAPPGLYIGCVGTRFLPGVREAIGAAAEAWQQAGLGSATVAVQLDLCARPYQGLGAMRNMLVMHARSMNPRPRYIALLDNDVLLDKPDIFVRAAKRLDRRHPYPGIGDNLYGGIDQWKAQAFVPRLLKGWQGPPDEPNLQYPPLTVTGWNELEWAVVACAMFQEDAFDLAGERAFTDHLIYCEDQYVWTWFRRRGVSLWQHPDLTATLLRPPTPLWDIRPTEIRKPETWAPS